MAILGVDPGTVDAMAPKHGHYDHFGRLFALAWRVKRGTQVHVASGGSFLRFSHFVMEFLNELGLPYASVRGHPTPKPPPEPTRWS